MKTPNPPAAAVEVQRQAEPEMTLRDLFAVHLHDAEEMSPYFAQALMGTPMPKNDSVMTSDAYWIAHEKWWSMALAKHRYMRADAMLKARTE